MLVCNVSQRAPRAGIVADIAEALDATDATASGQVVFATLVDDPASVGDLVDAYLGEIMVEAATAAVSVDAGLLLVVAIDEESNSADAVDWSEPVDVGFYGVLGIAGPIPLADPAPTIIYIEM